MASTLRRALCLLRVPGNQLGFCVRASLRWSRGVAMLPNEAKGALFAHLRGGALAAAQADERRLRRRYDLGALRQQSTVSGYAENLSLLRGLERLARGIGLPAAAPALRALDLGCGDFRYATALQRWLQRHEAGALRQVELRGIEIDGHGIYRDGHSRADHGSAHAALAGPGVRYEVADAARLAERGTQQVVTLFYPFLLPYALLRWGLPLHHYKPRRLLAAAVAALQPGGLLVVANQTGAEFDRLRLLLQPAPVALLRQTGFADAAVPFAGQTSDRVGSIWRRL